MLFHLLISLICIAESFAFLLKTIGGLPQENWMLLAQIENSVELSFFLCVSIPIIISGYQHVNKKGIILFTIAIAICIITIFATTSRAGFLCLLSYLYWGIGKIKHKLPPFVLSLILTLLLFIKKDSTLGRFFIISQSFLLIVQKPLSGWGHNGFQAQYMNAQADFFSRNPDSVFCMLADNIHHPLNEFLLITVNYGIVALGTILFFCFALFQYYVRNKTSNARIGMAILSSILIYSLFDYPFQFTITWFFLIYALFLIFQKEFQKRRLLSASLLVSATLISCFFVIHNKDKMIAYRE